MHFLFPRVCNFPCWCSELRSVRMWRSRNSRDQLLCF